MPVPEPTLDHPDAARIGYEPEPLVVEWNALDVAWPKGKTPIERWQIGRRHEACLGRIAEFEELIAGTDAQTLAGRRGPAPAARGHARRHRVGPSLPCRRAVLALRQIPA
jgi:hypothetical protein